MRSIKDYKDAMDSVRISESFYKRTETLLKELPEDEKPDKAAFRSVRRISAAAMTAAACAVCVIGLKIAVDGSRTNVSTTIYDESVSESFTESALELIDALEDEDGIFIAMAEPTFGDDPDPVSVSVQEDSDYDLDSGEDIVAGVNPLSDTSGEISYENTESESADAEKKSVRDNASVSHADAGGGDIPSSNAPAEVGGAASAGAAEESGEAVEYDMEYDETAEEDADAAENIRMLWDISLANVTVEITPYFNMEDIRSGEGSVKKKGTECAALMDFIAELSESSERLESVSFKSVFSLRITDENIGVTFYSIYLTDSQTMVVTKHDPDSWQRVAYKINAEDCDALMNVLFLMFGEDKDYELFKNLISGK